MTRETMTRKPAGNRTSEDFDRSNLRTEPNFTRLIDGDGEYYDGVSGYVVQSLVDGVHLYEMAGTFPTDELASQRADEIFFGVESQKVNFLYVGSSI